MNPLHYPSLEFCKKLTEIGFPMTEKFHMNGGIWDSLSDRWMSEYASWCPSVIEMLDVIPSEIKPTYQGLTIIKCTVNYVIRYGGEDFKIVSPSLPNALAEMILWLYENKFISFTK